MTDDSTLGGYVQRHGRPPAFEGSDGKAYSAEAYVDDVADAHGRHGAAILFVRWSPAGDAPDGHLETGYLIVGDTPAEAEAALGAIGLHEVKEHLERLIVAARERPDW